MRTDTPLVGCLVIYQFQLSGISVEAVGISKAFLLHINYIGSDKRDDGPKRIMRPAI